MNRYAELCQRHQQEVNALPIGFAFGNRQFEEMMRGWARPEKDLDKSTASAAQAATTRSRTRS